MTRALSTSAAIAAAAALAGAFGAAQAAPKAHKPPAAGVAHAPPGGPAAKTAPHVIYAIEQLVTGELSPVLMAQLMPVHTLREVEDVLKTNDIAFKWGKIEMRSADLSPEMIKQITALPPGEVFVVPQGSPPGQTMVFNVILRTRPE